MYKEILRAIGDRPAPYAPMAFPFWDDDYISEHFLAAHLNPDAEGATRSHAFVRKSAAWIATLGAGAFLDLGCGPGIYAELFAQHGFSVTGVDMSARSIAHARASAAQKGLDITYIRQNYLRLDDDSRFDMAALIYCDYGVLAPQDRQAMLRNVWRALKPGGRFVMDVWTRENYHGFPQDAWSVEDAPQGGFWSPQPHAVLERRMQYGEDVYLEMYHVMTEDSLRTYYVWNKAYTPETLRAELVAAGFSSMSFYGDIAGAPLTPESKTLCVVAVK